MPEIELDATRQQFDSKTYLDVTVDGVDVVNVVLDHEEDTVSVTTTDPSDPNSPVDGEYQYEV